MPSFLALLIGLAAATAGELGEDSKLFLPVLATAASARGSVTSSAALCTGTLVFTAFLSSILKRILLPVIYLYLAASVAGCAFFAKICLPFTIFLIILIFPTY